MDLEPRSVLLVDDESRTLELLGAMLRRRGFLVTAASSTKSAIDLLRANDFDAVVTDVVFDGRSSGKEVLRAARELRPASVVLLMTGYPAIDAAVSAMKDGANDYIEKPIDGQLLAAKIENALRDRKCREQHLEFGELVEIVSHLVSQTIERIDPYTAGHGERTRKYCDALAAKVGLDAPSRGKLALAAIAHDYGKIYLRDLSFLTKNGSLTDVEYAEVRRHPELGAEKIGDHVRLREVCTWIAEHHERWDGTGYPNRKRGAEISLSGRILAMVEVFDSLATKRSYKEAWELGRVVEFFRRERESAFDPDLLDLFVPLIEDNGSAWLAQPELDRRAARVG